MSTDVQTTCAIQFCAAKPANDTVMEWFCGVHRYPGGQGDDSVTVTAMGIDATFTDGVEYILDLQHSRLLRARVVGEFSLKDSGDTRLRFIGPDKAQFIEVDPDLLTRVVAF